MIDSSKARFQNWSVLVLLVFVTACSSFDYDEFRGHHTVPSGTAMPSGEDDLTVRFLGNTNLLISDGSSSLLIDGFFSYPVQNAFQALLSRVQPDAERVNAATTAPEFSNLDAIIITHSHHDHAMDVGELANKFFDAIIIGSETTSHILDGWARWRGIELESLAHKTLMRRLRIPNMGNDYSVTRRAIYSFGSFTVTILKGNHAKTAFGFLEADRLGEPLVPPRRISNYASGDVYIVHVAHAPSAQSLAIVGSAGIPTDGILEDLRADVLFLAVAAMPRNRGLPQYLDGTIGALRPNVVVPIHWDSQFDLPQDGEVIEPSGLYALGARVGSGLKNVRDYVEHNFPASRFLMLPYDDRVALSKL